MLKMAIVKATYTRNIHVAKAALRYIQHRRAREGKKITRRLYGSDGVMGRDQAYQMIDEAAKGTVFFRLVISPDPAKEDAQKDLRLEGLTTQTMLHLEERLQKPVPYVAVEHNDHAPNRHVHVIACVQGRLNPQDFQALRESATQAALFQRQERDLAQQQKELEQEGLGWGE